MTTLHPQYITNSTGEKLSVVLPLKEFNSIMKELEMLDDIRRDNQIDAKQETDTDIPAWHQGVVRERLANYQANPNQALDFEKAIDDIESEL